MSDNDEYVIVWEAPEIQKPEFRLYYDEEGKVLFYTCEKPEGNYIVIDALTYAQSRPDVLVVDGKIVSEKYIIMISRLYPSDTGILCELEDVSIITEADGQYWKLKTYSL